MRETFANGRVRSWASILDDNAREAAERTAELAILSLPVALMPDAHLGHGATIGSVLVTEDAVIPMAVGVDIGCGMAARRLALDLGDLGDGDAAAWVEAVGRLVPAGLGHWDRAMSDEAAEFIACDPAPSRVDDVPLAGRQIGTLGAGNHFVELSVDELGQVWILLHSGSRGAGNKLARVYGDAAALLHGADVPLKPHPSAERAAAGETVPELDLAWLDRGGSEFAAYVADVSWAQRYALENRRQILRRAHAALEEVAGKRLLIEDEVNCHHNYVSFEGVAELGRHAYVTRKGAIAAHVSSRGLIPGAMGQASFVVSGLGNPESYESCSHGAGRVMSRGRARKEVALEDFAARMEGVAWQDGDAASLLDESPQAYKDVETVMADQADLVRVDYRLRAIANYKGVDDRRRKTGGTR
jgi:tRNA-splicing ligase RtcB